MNYQFQKTDTNQILESLKNNWLKTLTRPQDGMWASFRENGTNYEIWKAESIVGYVCLGEENLLLQFYVFPEYMKNSLVIFEYLIHHLNIKKAMVGTNNPIFLSNALHFSKGLEIHSYLFSDGFKVEFEEKEGDFSQCQPKELDKVVDFCHNSMAAPKEWLLGYIGDLIEKEEIFSLQKNNKIIGTCEVRKSISAPNFADIGMVISPNYRKQGYGTYLLNKAKSIAISSGRKPICSCEKENIGSLKSIENCGFINLHQLLAIDFN